MHSQTDTDPSSIPTAATVAPTVDALKQRIISLFIRGAFAMHSKELEAMPTRDELRAITMAALDLAAANVAESDACHVENTRRAMIDLLSGCPTARLWKRDALFTLGALLDVGLLDSFSELVQSDVMSDIATTVIAKVAAEQIVIDKVGGK